MTDNADARQYRTMFLSDIHLGTKGCQADLLLDFLRWHDAETIYLVGDSLIERVWFLDQPTPCSAP